MSISIRRHRRTIKPLGDVIDVYKCMGCGATVAVAADAQTFSQPPPLECKACPGQPDMDPGRYHARNPMGPYEHTTPRRVNLLP